MNNFDDFPSPFEYQPKSRGVLAPEYNAVPFGSYLRENPPILLIMLLAKRLGGVSFDEFARIAKIGTESIAVLRSRIFESSTMHLNDHGVVSLTSLGEATAEQYLNVALDSTIKTLDELEHKIASSTH